MRQIGAHVAGITLRDGTQTLATAQLLRRRIGPLRLSWLARGPVIGPSLQASNVIAKMRLPDLSIAIPDDPGISAWFSDLGYRALLTPQHVAEIDLRLSRETRFAAQHGKWRNRLRAALASPIKTEARPFDTGRDTHLVALEMSQRKSRGYASLPAAFTMAYATTSPDAARLYLARDRSGIVAFMLFLLHPPVASYHIGWTDPAGRAHHAHNLLLWQASNDLADRGFTRLDLGSIDTETAAGLARFKLGSGATARALGSTLLRLLPPRRHRLAA
ncbi:MAG: GNAT family N-acetyltransferase [Pseudomonadota bacterium]